MASNPVYKPVDDIPHLFLNTETGTYYVRKFRAGKGELFRSTRSKKKGEAKNIAEDMINAWLGNKGKTHRRLRLAPVADDLLDYYRGLHEQTDEHGRPLRRKATWKHDQAMLKFIKEHFGENFLDELDEQFWDDWVDETGRPMRRTLYDVAKYMSLLMAFAFRRKLVNRKPSFRNPDKYKSKAVVYEDADILIFLKHSDPLLHDMIILAAENPLRPHEVREMRWEFLTFEKDGRVVLRLPAWFTKTERDRELELSSNASQMLRRRRKANLGIKSLFVFHGRLNPGKPLSDVMLSKKWRGMLRRAGIQKPLRFHWLRHSVYTKLLLDAKLPIQEVSEAGGTSIPVLQQRYLKGDHARTRAVSQAIHLDLKGEEE